MINRLFIIFSLLASSVFSGEISVSISEELVNDYLRLIGDHQIPKGKSGNKALWTIKEPQVKFEEGSAEFLASVYYKKGKTNIKKTSVKATKIKKALLIEKCFYQSGVGGVRTLVQTTIYLAFYMLSF